MGPTKNQVAAQIYAVVLGFILVYGFSEFNDARQNVQKEAATLGRLMAQAHLAGEEAGQSIIAAVRGYSETVASQGMAADGQWRRKHRSPDLAPQAGQAPFMTAAALPMGH